MTAAWILGVALLVASLFTPPDRARRSLVIALLAVLVLTLHAAWAWGWLT